ncbi:MAG: hypothetical protein KKA60_09410 [Proteobacteria bacterium]|nr:hypothetical protein [Pseudomonadota bacterium]
MTGPLALAKRTIAAAFHPITAAREASAALRPARLKAWTLVRFLADWRIRQLSGPPPSPPGEKPPETRRDIEID